MTEASVKHRRTGRILPAVLSTVVHGGCWLALLALLWGPVAVWVTAAEEYGLWLNPLTHTLLRFFYLVIHYPLATLVCLLVAVVGDFLVLFYLGRSGWRDIAREIWSGVVVLCTVLVFSVFTMSPILDTAHFGFSVSRGDCIEEQQRLQPLEQLVGTWRLVSKEQGGESIANSELPSGELVIERYENRGVLSQYAEYDPQDHRVAYHFRWTVGDQERHGQVGLLIRYATEWIELVDTLGQSEHWQQIGIYRRNGDRLELCLSPPGIRGWDLPTEFSTKDGDAVLYVFDRVEP